MARPAREVTFQQLRYLVALVDHGHFGRAAAACHVSQPTLSAQLRRLEERLGVPLVDRAATPVLPTALGRRLAGRAQALLAGRDELVGLARSEGDELRGALRLGAIPTVAPYVLPDLASHAQTAWPEVHLEVVERATYELTERLRRAEIDAALIATDERDSAWSTRVIGREPFVAYMSPGHPLLASERLDARSLAREKLWLLADGHCFRDQVLAACGTERASGVGTVRFESGSLDTLQRMVDAAGGLTLLPRMALAGVSPAAQGRVRELSAPAPERTLRLLVRRSYGKRRIAAELASALAAAGT